ncbi:ATP-binding cassette domain-containing protein [Vibrio nitrifigilis]|uniref:ABC transporter ATP-binding protein n=1 Tax=Vibrio nitrifigilis TaxID=2789781 RepID=A0ABS0GM83_9VIBR|nr:ABC transporter ATP-binding protein [Vibrio nitrifigilis]MBF9003566.1 ABC transporter ATP-binding protein [Vibrio nitrifigilis]
MQPIDSSRSILTVDNLSISINGQILVENINLSLSQGERVCLLGASGSGKSLTAQAINGTLPPYCDVSGSININGIDVTAKPVLARQPQGRVATIFQDTFSALNPLMSVGKQLSLSTQNRSNHELHDVLAQMHIDPTSDLLSRLPSELSGGQRQRLCIALALLSGANVLVADEPTTALDVLSQKQVIELLKQYCGPQHLCAHDEHLHGSPLSLLFITHDINVAAELCDRAIVIYQGKIVEQAPMHQLLRYPQHPYTQSLVQAVKSSRLSHITAANSATRAYA